jgi:DNA-binding response OmpR family regulator
MLGLESGADDYIAKPFGMRNCCSDPRAHTVQSRDLVSTASAGSLVRELPSRYAAGVQPAVSLAGRQHRLQSRR